ncbi:hypothetical protein GCM10011352_02660 [Marinobacterium zhoushanense]|uniref:DUF1722 domain-containing protein n=1 Tax=Marinobacterium zhoushanense TaxID=1679163 RepID=A0ABQ1K122_9GAMM|nr:DUF523 and DUF1722 domain-containing protein [Marinobacterium zhoushanense]GGB80422.1 hypothetical protein GCM10011352_02660 [Marinobacterium zhoushanense]
MAEIKPLVLEQKIPVGISSCLLGEQVRYNGGHKRSRYCLEVLADCFSYRPYCPEVAIGLGVPREPIRLVAEGDDQPRALGTVDATVDVTDRLLEYGRQIGESSTELRGYILMKGSPSCGMERVKVYHPNGMPNTAGTGIFVRALCEANPELPVEEEARLNDPVLRDNFIARVFAYDDWKRSVEADPSYHNLIQFHSRQKYLLMAHHYQGYRELGRYLAEAHQLPLQQAMQQYIQNFMQHMAHRASRKTHTNVLMHLLGYMKKSLDPDCKQELLEGIEQYRLGQVPLVVPLALLKHYLKRYGSEYVCEQTYLNPYPHELGLRNFI